MATQQEEECKDTSIRKSFNAMEFPKVEDKLDVIVQYDANSQSLSINFTNTITKNTFKQNFDKDYINKITNNMITPQLLAQMIVDTLSSKEKTSQNSRIFLYPNIKQGSAFMIILVLCTYEHIFTQQNTTQPQSNLMKLHHQSKSQMLLISHLVINQNQTVTPQKIIN